MKATDRQALERLVIDGRELEAIEARLARFNFFEAAGLVRHEIRHSQFLSFLLDPAQAHGLGDAFLRQLLQDVLSQEEAAALHSLSPLQIHLLDLSGSTVRREWRNIDVVVENSAAKLVLAIENKVGIGEHSDQLRRYRETLEREYGIDWQTVLILLSPDGITPTDERYLPVSYDTIYQIISRLLARFTTQMNPDVAVALRHYKELLSTHVTNDPELDALCDAIYRKHRQALDLIFERRAGTRALLQRTIDGWIESNAERVFVDYTSKAYIRFVPKEWEPYSFVKNVYLGRENRTLYFLFTNGENSLTLSIEMHLGEPEYRQRVIDLAQANQPPFKLPKKKAGAKFATLYTRNVLVADDYKSDQPEELAQKVLAFLNKFMQEDLPAFTEALRKGFE